MADAMYVLSSDCKMRPSEQKLATQLWAGDEDGRGRTRTVHPGRRPLVGLQLPSADSS